MRAHPTDRGFPRGPLLAAATLVAGSLLLVTATRLTGIGAMRLPEAQIVVSRNFRFADDPSGAVTVFDASQNKVIGEVAPGVGGFVRATLRGLGRERKRRGNSKDEPFRLAIWSDGRFTLEDLATGRKIDLEAFGPTNAEAFAKFLNAQEAASVSTASK